MEARSHALLIFSFIAWARRRRGRGGEEGGRAAAVAGVERWRRRAVVVDFGWCLGMGRHRDRERGI
jgi:hypothetical protein